MKTASTPSKAKSSAKARPEGKMMTPAQIKKFKAMCAEMDAFWGDRNTGSVDFLLKMRRGEV